MTDSKLPETGSAMEPVAIASTVSVKSSGLPLRFLAPLLIFVALLALFFVGLGKDPTELPSVLTGKPMPAFQLPVLGEETRVLTQNDLRGKPYLLNVWATWCPTCYVEHPYLLELARQNRIRLIGLNYKDDRNKALQYLAKLGNPYETTLIDADGMLGIDLGVYGAPETFLVSADGVILYRRAGDLNERVWQDEIVPLLAQAGVQP
ncbi:MAG TPA: DsbE family thiol:disulfide interchange protein [Permianibacter sp.]|nr:DsbE family thiol:disulfide interchange protein [Permianibacter sp.]